jgi:hypothetical protein
MEGYHLCVFVGQEYLASIFSRTRSVLGSWCLADVVFNIVWQSTAPKRKLTPGLMKFLKDFLLYTPANEP